VPTLFGGWFYGGTVLMLRAADATRPEAPRHDEQVQREERQAA
jgi:hypothetical protein